MAANQQVKRTSSNHNVVLLWKKVDFFLFIRKSLKNRVGSGTMNLGGSLTRQIEQDASVSEASPHIANIGKMVEEMENKIR